MNFEFLSYEFYFLFELITRILYIYISNSYWFHKEIRRDFQSLEERSYIFPFEMYNNSSGRCTSVKFLSWNWLQSVICFPDPRFAGLAFNLAAGSDLLVYMSMPARRRDQGDEIHPLSSLQANGYVALSCWL